MFRLFNFIVFVIATVYAAGEFSVLNSPESVVFEGHDQVKESTLIEAISAALGFTTEKYSKWEGIYITDPFSLPEAAVTVVIDGVSDIGLVKGHHFPMRTDEDEATIYESVAKRISSRYPEQKSNLVRIDFSDDLNEIQLHNILGPIKTDKPQRNSHLYLRNDVDEDREFLREIGLLNAITNKIEKGAVKKDFIPDIYWFKVSSLHPLQDLYGENATAVKEAKQLLNEAILRLNEAFIRAYDGSVLVTVITSDASHTRRSRSILQAATPKEKTQNPHNLAKNYSKNYPVIFNIILWFGVIMVFTLLAISMVIGTMDPGRDSIIYRMTSTRMKKDN